MSIKNAGEIVELARQEGYDDAIADVIACAVSLGAGLLHIGMSSDAKVLDAFVKTLNSGDAKGFAKRAVKL